MTDDLFSERMKADRQADTLARGEPPPPLADEASVEFRWQVVYALRDCSTMAHREREAYQYAPYRESPVPNSGEVYETISGYLLRKYGKGPVLTEAKFGGAEHNLEHFVLLGASTEHVMDVIEAFLGTGVESMYVPYRDWAAEEFTQRVRAALRQQGMAYDLVEGSVVPKSSDELFEEVVRPTLSLLHGRAGFEEVEEQYQDALREMREGHWPDAVTDANSAAEHTLRLLLGFEQGQLPGLLAEARQRGWFTETQEGWLKKTVDGLAALSQVRSTEGDAHHPGTADEALAWLAIHWAGALIVFFLQRIKP